MNNEIKPSQPSSVGVVEGRFRDVDEFAETIPGWTFDFRQLDRGALTADYRSIASGGGVLTRIRLSRGFHQAGAPPPGMRTYTIAEDEMHGIRWCGDSVTSNTVQRFSAADDFDAVSQPDFCAYTLSFPEEQLVRTGELRGLPDPQELLQGTGEVTTCDPHLMNELRRRVRSLFIRNEKSDSPLSTPASDDEWAAEVPALLVEGLASSRNRADRRYDGSARLVVKHALEFMEAYASEPTTVSEVSRATGVSRRTLNYAFRAELEVTPKQYLQAIRLDGVRKELRDAPASTTIADVANHWGFWHLGQFAADYRRQFGELPSETLARRE